MPILAALNNKHSGFTLIELLIVLVLIGTLVGAVFNQVGFRSMDDAVEQATRQLSYSITKAMDVSALKQTDIALFASQKNYVWKEIQISKDNKVQTITWVDFEARWPVQGDLPENLVLSALVDDVNIELPVELLDDPELIPFIIVQRDGEIFPPVIFEITNNSNTEKSRIVLDGVHEPEIELHAL